MDGKVLSSTADYTEDFIQSSYKYETTQVEILPENIFKVTPKTTELTFLVEKKLPKLGVMLVGWGGNNGTTVTAAVLANSMKLKWRTKEGIHEADYLGSLMQSSTIHLGTDSSSGEDVYIPMRNILPMIHPNDIVFDGWDISSLNLADAMERAKVVDYDLQRQLRGRMQEMKPRASIYDGSFIAANQSDRADNVIPGTKWHQLQQVRADIRDFRTKNKLDKVIVLWTANTERFAAIKPGVNDTADALLRSVEKNDTEISPSTLYAVASILEGCAYLNGSPQNTFVPGLIQLAEQHNVFIGGDDFKSGQTKIKSVLVDFLINAGIKPKSIVSYNHLGNNDGKNLSAPAQFHSKEVSKSNVVDDMVASNKILYKPEEKPDHCVVIKYVPYVGDSKRAMDEYVSQIMLGGHNTIVIHNTCEDSLLASPIILDLIILTELFQRVWVKTKDATDFESFHCILSILSYLFKAPLSNPGAAVVNAFYKQRCCIENVLRAFIGLPPINNMGLEHKLKSFAPTLMKDVVKEAAETKLKSQEHVKEFHFKSEVILEAVSP